MNTHHHKTKFAAIAATLTIALLALASENGAKPGDPFPDLKTFNLEGKLPDSLKGHVVIVDFWASWCGPCAKSFPALNELYQAYKDRDVIILAVSVDEKAEAMQKFLSKHAAEFVVVRDTEQKLVEQLNVATMPTSFILDAKGTIRFVHNGFHGDETRKAYAGEIESLLKSQ